MNVLGPVRAVLAVAAGVGLVYGAQHADAEVFWTRRGDVLQVHVASSATRSAVVCPGADQPDDRSVAASILTALAPRSVLPPEGSSGPAGSVTATRLPRPAGGVPRVATGRGPATVDTATGAGAVSVVGTGRDARGLLAMQTSQVDDSSGRGMMLLQCTAPSREAWLAGGGAEPGRLGRLVLSNPGDGPVTVDVDVMGRSGVSRTRSVHGVVVPASGRRVVVLGALDAGLSDPVMRVTASGGLVQASLFDVWMTGETRSGEELTGPIAGPATSQVLPAVAAMGDEPRVRVAVPGHDEAIVRVRATSTDGAVVADQVATVPGGRTRALPLRGMTPGTYAVQVTADVPVVASAISRTAASGTTDFAWMPAATAIGTLAGFAQPAPVSGSSSVLMLTSPGTNATVRLTTTVHGATAAKVVQVPAGRPVAVAVDAATSGWIEVTHGHVYAGLVRHAKDASGPLLTAVSLQPVPVRSNVSDVQPQIP